MPSTKILTWFTNASALVFQVEDAGGNALPSAIFLGAVAIEANILLATDGTMASYIQNIPAISSPAAGPGE